MFSLLVLFLPAVIGFVTNTNPATNTRTYRHHINSKRGNAQSSILFLANNDKPSIAIVGSGAVGCYYGARLYETDKYNVIFHMRGDHYKASKANGLKVTSVNGDIFIPPDQLQAYDKTDDIGKVDWVIMALKSTGVDATPGLLLPLLGKNSRVLCIMNGLVDDDIVRLLEGEDDEDVEPRLTKCAAVYAGMALLCSNRISPGHVDHSYAGKLTASLAKSSSDDLDDIKLHKEMMQDLWEPTQGFEFVYDDNYTKARWTKNVWNLPFNGISVAMNGITVDKIVNDPGLRRLAFNIMDETIAVANKDLETRGFPPTDFLGEAEVRLSFSFKNYLATFLC
jgi:2-dehydropantoate 2-reductase